VGSSASGATVQKGRRNTQPNILDPKSLTSGSKKVEKSKHSSSGKKSPGQQSKHDNVENVSMLPQSQLRPAAAKPQPRTGFEEWGIQTAPIEWAPKTVNIDTAETDKVPESQLIDPLTGAVMVAPRKLSIVSGSNMNAGSNGWSTNLSKNGWVNSAVNLGTANSPATGRSTASTDPRPSKPFRQRASPEVDELDGMKVGGMDKTHQSAGGSTLTIDRCIADNRYLQNVAGARQGGNALAPLNNANLGNISEQTNGNSANSASSNLRLEVAGIQHVDDNRGLYESAVLKAVGPPAAAKVIIPSAARQLLHGLGNVYSERVQYVTDTNSGAIYAKGKLLGKVNIMNRSFHQFFK